MAWELKLNARDFALCLVRPKLTRGINGSMSYEDMFNAYILRRQRRRAGREDQDFEREREEEDFARDALNQHRQLEGGVLALVEKP
eukprot:1156662-Pelagomonas_calceolata.AAC.3